MRLRILSTLTLITLFGCGPICQRMYPGPAQPKTNVAVIKTLQQPSLISRADVYIYAVDGERIKYKWTETGQFFYDGTSRAEVLPGHHIVECGYFNCGTVSKGSIYLEFEAEAGHEYVLDREVSFEQMKWRPFIRDASLQGN